MILSVTLTGCQTIYYNSKYPDPNSAQINFQQDLMRCRAYANGSIPIPPSYQVQNYQYHVNGTAYTQPTFGGYETTYDAQVTATPSSTDAMLSSMNSVFQIASLVARENRYENCLKSLGWTTDKKEAFPNEDLLLDAPLEATGALDPDFYEPVQRSEKLPFSVAVPALSLAPLVFKNGGNTYTLNVEGFNDALLKEISQHFSEVTSKSNADINSIVSVQFSVTPTEKKYSGYLVIEFRDKINRPIYVARYQNTQTITTIETKLDGLSKILTEEALKDLIGHTGWIMSQRDFRDSFTQLTN